MVLANSTINNPGIILAIIVGVAAAIAIIAFIIYKILHPKLKSEKEKPSEEQIVKEEMERILKPIEDDDVAEKVNEYKEDDDE
ncbi:MAG: hypothetical protein MJ227_00260 [Bacilli bacterium]|nr:hypothetical protein [Bacilli bacterium]